MRAALDRAVDNDQSGVGVDDQLQLRSIAVPLCDRSFRTRALSPAPVVSPDCDPDFCLDLDLANSGASPAAP